MLAEVSYDAPLYNDSLLADLQLARVSVVLVSPRNPLNIGAAARALANFGFSQLTVVAPYEPHWREAQSAVGAEDLLHSARKVHTLSEAVADCTLVLGTASLTRRKPEQPVVSLPDLAPIVRDELARNGRIALVFGSEKRGLARDDLALCHLLVTAPTDPRQPSMNLGQAVAVFLYELSSRFALSTRELGAPCPSPLGTGATRLPHPRDVSALVARVGDVGAPEPALSLPKGPSPLGTGETQVPHPRDVSVLVARVGDVGAPGPSPLGTGEIAPSVPSRATSHDLDLLVEVITKTMDAANYSPTIMRGANRHDLHLLLRRLALSQPDARRILGLFRRILFSLQHPATHSNKQSTRVPPK